MELLLWFSLALVVYPYAGYPALLILINRIRKRVPRSSAEQLPTVTILMAVHNERAKLEGKITNLLALDYPVDRLQFIVIGDGCTDDSLEIVMRAGGGRVATVALAARGGKAAALNAGLQASHGQIVVFTDAGILLERGSLRALVSHFADSSVGCVSGEDHVPGNASEGVYGRLELLLRREEAQLHSIAGASGCFYAQRRELVKPFPPGQAPDFLSVLLTVEQGYRAVAEPLASGVMTASPNQKAEFARKTRTFLRGMTALAAHVRLLNPLRHPAFSFILWSHKVLRWFAAIPMLAVLVSSALLAEQRLYLVAFTAQAIAYSAAVAGILAPTIAARSRLLSIVSFFVLVQVASVKAMLQWGAGVRVEVWQPTQRAA